MLCTNLSLFFFSPSECSGSVAPWVIGARKMAMLIRVRTTLFRYLGLPPIDRHQTLDKIPPMLFEHLDQRKTVNWSTGVREL